MVWLGWVGMGLVWVCCGGWMGIVEVDGCV